MLVVDTHTHVISPDRAKYPLDPLGGHQSRWSEDHPVDADGLLRVLDEAGIDKAVVVQASTVYGHDNSYVAATVAAHRDRLAGVFSIDVLAADGLDQLKRWLDDGLSGLRLFTTGTTMPGQANWLDDPRSFPVWDHCEANDIPVCLQMKTEGIAMLRNLLTRFPKVRVLLDHLARPELDDGPPYAKAAALFGLADAPGVYLKLTDRAIGLANEGKSTADAFLTTIVDAFGADRIAWGSNFPAAEGKLADILARSRAAMEALDESARRTIMGGTAIALYPGLRETANG